MTEDRISPTRERIVKAAAHLFYLEGIRSVSVDAIAERTGVTKKTLYYHFTSKDDLIAAYLVQRDPPNLAAFARWLQEAEGNLPERIEAFFTRVAMAAKHPNWKGCGFLRTTAELANLPGTRRGRWRQRTRRRSRFGWPTSSANPGFLRPRL